jgi:hypothetical protein
MNRLGFQAPATDDADGIICANLRDLRALSLCLGSLRLGAFALNGWVVGAFPLSAFRFPLLISLARWSDRR